MTTAPRPPGPAPKRRSAASILRRLGWTSSHLAAALSDLTGAPVERRDADHWLHQDRTTARITLALLTMTPDALGAFQERAGFRPETYEKRDTSEDPRRDLRRLLKKLGAPAPGARPFAPRPPDRDAKGRIKAFARTGRGRREVAQAGPATVHVTAWTSLDAGLPANVSVRGSTAPVIRVLKGEDRFLRF